MYGRCGKKHKPERPTGGRVTLPLDDGHRPAITLSTELLPHPLGPIMMVFTGTRRLNPVHKGVLLFGAITQTLTMSMPSAGCFCVWAEMEAVLMSEEFEAEEKSRWVDLAPICSKVRSRCSTRWPQPNADDKGPDTPANVTTAMNKKTSKDEEKMRSCDASAALPTPADTAVM